MLSELEQHYFLAFTGFIAREHHLAKTGLQGAENINGQAALWLESFEDKKQSFQVINHLKFIESSFQNERDYYLNFEKTETTIPLANFRKGDIAVLYPILPEGLGPLNQQIYKCTIIENSPNRVKVRLRARQTNDHNFNTWEYWNLEHDMMDSGFNAMYTQLRSWLYSSPQQRSLLLGTRPPRINQISLPLPSYPGLTDQQAQILQKALSAEEYFLLWGPPGTGKTSIMIKHLVRFLWEQTDQHILLMAYTNRAVDEICKAINSIGASILETYFRVGSKYSTAEVHHRQLLSNKIQAIDKRKDLKELIASHRIVVGTVASIANKPELFQLKSFQTAIIDEASQILEPNLIGLLGRFKKFILVGDHKQLPAVVVQDQNRATVKDEQLKELGLINLSNSLFDRMYKRALAKDWHWAFDQLSYQGRMHQQIMGFPNHYFYNQTLSILPENIPTHIKQKQALSTEIPAADHPLSQALSTQRMIFIDTPVNTQSVDYKTNMHEAQTITKILHHLPLIHGEQTTNEEYIGVITPYRAQIATIKKALADQNMDATHLTIDTVERYQGGSRQIIIISLCSNHIDRLKMMTSISEEGVDRKLNVALTRAKEQLIILGNRKVLEGLPLYKALLEYCYCI